MVEGVARVVGRREQCQVMQGVGRVAERQGCRVSVVNWGGMLVGMPAAGQVQQPGAAGKRKRVVEQQHCVAAREQWRPHWEPERGPVVAGGVLDQHRHQVQVVEVEVDQRRGRSSPPGPAGRREARHEWDGSAPRSRQGRPLQRQLTVRWARCDDRAPQERCGAERSRSR